MDRDALVTCLRSAADAARRVLGRQVRDGRARWAHIPPATVLPFGNALLRNASIAELDGSWYTLPYQGGRLDFRSAAIYLIDRALDVNPAEIIDDLLRFVSEKTIELISVRAVEGIVVDAPIELMDGFSISPPVALPDVPETRAVFSEDNAPRHGWGSAPSAAIVRRETFRVPFDQAPVEEKAIRLLDRSEVESRMDCALWAATLASTGAPQFRQSYDVIASCGWPGMTSGATRASESFPVLVPYMRKVDASMVRELFSHLKSQPGKLHLAMTKLQASRRRESLAERAVDLGTCLEVMLMHESTSNTEISYKIATRAAWLLGGDGEERLSIFKQARDLYNARSLAVHSGTSPKTDRNSPDAVKTSLDSYDKLCASVIAKIALRGGWPDWLKLVLDVA